MGDTHERLYALSEGKVSTWHKEHLERKAKKQKAMNRKVGAYWVRMKAKQNWGIAYYTHWGDWEIWGKDAALNDSDFEEIDETPITRNEN